MSIFSDFDASFDDDGSEFSFNNPDGISFNDDGDFVLREDNLDGGHDTFVNGAEVTHTASNVNGGTDIYHDGLLNEQTIPNAEGGEDLYNSDMQYEGSILPDGIGGEDFFSVTGNTDSILEEDDPLASMDTWEPPSLDIGASDSFDFDSDTFDTSTTDSFSSSDTIGNDSQI